MLGLQRRRMRRLRQPIMIGWPTSWIAAARRRGSTPQPRAYSAAQDVLGTLTFRSAEA
jgi:hypothetical protein